MRPVLVVLLVLLAAPALAEERCFYESGTMWLELHSTHTLTVYGAAEGPRDCVLTDTDIETEKTIQCGDFTGKAIIEPGPVDGAQPNVIILVPTIFVRRCSTGD